MVQLQFWKKGSKSKEGSGSNDDGQAGEGKVDISEYKRFILKQFWNRRWNVVDEYDRLPSADDLAGVLEPGKYRVDGIRKNGTFKALSTFNAEDPDTKEVPIGDAAGTPSREVKRENPLKSILNEYAEQKKEFAEIGSMMRNIFLDDNSGGNNGGGGKTMEQSFMEFIKKDKAEFAEKAAVYGYIPRSGAPASEYPGMEITGKMPWYVAYGPELVDKFADRFERRLERMGIIDSPNIKDEREVSQKIEAPLPKISELQDIPHINTDAISSSSGITEKEKASAVSSAKSSVVSSAKSSVVSSAVDSANDGVVRESFKAGGDNNGGSNALNSEEMK